MPYTISEAIVDNVAEQRLLLALENKYPDAWYDRDLRGWRSQSLRLDECDDFTLNDDVVMLCKKVDGARIYPTVSVGGGNILSRSVGVS